MVPLSRIAYDADWEAITEYEGDSCLAQSVEETGMVWTRALLKTLKSWEGI